MAKFQIKFFDCVHPEAHLIIEKLNTLNENSNAMVINIKGTDGDGNDFYFWLDKSTAIKLSKQLRTEINKITQIENE